MYVDFSILGTSSVPLELVRSYNSITAASEPTGWLGAFGWGWTTPFETTLTTTPERNVILRDGGSGNTILFKPEKEDPKATAEFFENLKFAYFERKNGRTYTNAELAKEKFPDTMLSQLKNDPIYRAEIAEKYGVKSVPSGDIMISSEYGYQTMQFKNNQWIREKDGITQVFDAQGRLTRQKDKNGSVFEFKYSPSQNGQLIEISDPNRSVSLKFTWTGDRVTEVRDNRNQVARYQYDGFNNLIASTDSSNTTYLYKYENKKFPHLLTKIHYQNESGPKAQIYREVGYDDSGLVNYHRDKDGSTITFIYGKNQSDPENNFWTKSVVKRATQTEEQYDEFFIKARPDGSKYLYKNENRANGNTTITVYTACCGKPQQIVKNGETTQFKYYPNGLLQERVSPTEDSKFEYESRWKKISKVKQNGVFSNYEYDSRGNLVRATNSKNEKLSLKYDKSGRILEMLDKEGKHISFQYNKFGKPTLVTEKGVGTIKIDYDQNGKITKTSTLAIKNTGMRTPSDAQSQEVIRRVMKGFQNLLDIIRPAGSVMAN